MKEKTSENRIEMKAEKRKVTDSRLHGNIRD